MAVIRRPSDPMRCSEIRTGPDPSHLMQHAMSAIRGSVNTTSTQAITRSPKRVTRSRSNPCRPCSAEPALRSVVPHAPDPDPGNDDFSLATRFWERGPAGSRGIFGFIPPGRPHPKRSVGSFVQRCAKLPHDTFGEPRCESLPGVHCLNPWPRSARTLKWIQAP